MKVRLLTIYDVNYGNRLQNYAAYKLLCEYAQEVSNLYVTDDRRCVYTSQPRNNKLKRFIKKFIPTSYFRWKKKTCVVNSLEVQKEKVFRDFTLKYMRSEWITITRSKELNYSVDNKKYDMYFVGSDQVWNPDFAGNDFFFLDFVESRKRASVSASIGYDFLDKKTIKKYTRYWKNMNYISVREESAANIIKEATGRTVDVLLDPTMLLSCKEWEEVLIKPNFCVPSSYILVVFLGIIPNDIIEKYKKKYELEVIILNEKAFEEYYLTGPAEFLYLVKNASIVLTDSFHCTVFSIIFHTQFFVFRRDTNKLKNMFSRMETLLNRMGYLDRVQENNSEIEMDMIEEERFGVSDKIMENERNRIQLILSNLLH